MPGEGHRVQYGHYALGFGLSAASLALLASVVDWSDTERALGRADPAFLGLAVVFLLVSVAAKALRWRLLLPPVPDRGRVRIYRILHIGFLLNNVLPMRLGDLARITMASRLKGIRIGHVLSSLLAERVADVLVLLLAFMVISFFLPISETAQSWLRVAWVGIGVGGALVVALFFVRGKLSSLPRPRNLLARLPGATRISGESTSFAEGWRFVASRRNARAIVSWSVLAWGAAFAINYMLIQSLGIRAPFAVAILLTCTTNFAMLIPSSPAYIGVFHAAATFSLMPFGVDRGTALSFAILAHMVNVLPVSLLGAGFLLLGRDISLSSLRRGVAEPVSTDRTS